MPQGFTNSWDDSQPPDATAKANQLGVYLRQLKIDTQQRMAAVSGGQITSSNPLPSFNADQQPANWVSVLYFIVNSDSIATIPFGSTVYQFQNPTSPAFAIVPGFLGPVRIGETFNNAFTGITGRTFVTWLTMPAGTMTANGGRRIRLTLTMGVQPGGPLAGPFVEIVLATGIDTPGTSLALGLADFRTGFSFPLSGTGYIWGGTDPNSPTTQVWMANNSQRGSEILGNMYLYNSVNGAANESLPVRTSFDLTQTLYFNLYIMPNLTTDLFTLHTFAVEAL